VTADERFNDRLPIAANTGSLVGVLAVKLSGLKAIGLLGSRFNTGFHADYLGKYAGAVIGIGVLLATCAMQEDED
jgi:hypothetical protein